jgi:hypothetical protein
VRRWSLTLGFVGVGTSADGAQMTMAKQRVRTVNYNYDYNHR